jgi:hypothetical protein
MPAPPEKFKRTVPVPGLTGEIDHVVNAWTTLKITAPLTAHRCRRRPVGYVEDTQPRAEGNIYSNGHASKKRPAEPPLIILGEGYDKERIAYQIPERVMPIVGRWSPPHSSKLGVGPGYFSAFVTLSVSG